MGPEQTIGRRRNVETILPCDQAIFTSIRTPMGEGYRIVAASKGVGPEEKRAITRFSPSHDALCFAPDGRRGTGSGVAGVAFYCLPSGRLCVARSCYAGAEHTGRGGQRIYTHNCIFDASDFPSWGYNPFDVLRSMMESGTTSPQLSPPPVLPQLQLSLTPDTHRNRGPAVNASLTSPCRRHVLESLLDGRDLILNFRGRWLEPGRSGPQTKTDGDRQERLVGPDDLTGNWLEIAEALLLGIPGPLRLQVPFSAGLRFSIGRRHRLHLVCDTTGATETRVTGQTIEYIEPASMEPGSFRSSAWAVFVDRHWESGDTARLGRRTSRAFEDLSPAGLDRIAQLYTAIDDVSRTETPDLFSLVAEHLDGKAGEVERQIIAEFLASAQGELVGRFTGKPWMEMTSHWQGLIDLGRRSASGATFSFPVVDQALRNLMQTDAVQAAEAALPVAHDTSESREPAEQSILLNAVLSHLARWAERADDTELERVSDVCARWRRLRPACPIVQRIRRLLQTA